VKKVPQKTLTDTLRAASDVRESKKSKKKRHTGQKKKTRKTLMNSSLDSLSFGSFFILRVGAAFFCARILLLRRSFLHS